MQSDGNPRFPFAPKLIRTMKKLLSSATIATALAFTACASPGERNTATSAPLEEAAPPADPGAPAPTPPTGLITWTLIPRNSYVLADGNHETYLYLNLRSGADDRERARTPLNISLVLDRSGSMAGDKIAYARKAAKAVIDRLGPEDLVSIVNYDDRVEVTSPQQPVRNKEELKRKIDRISDRGSTALTDGMREGYRQIQSQKREGYVNRVLLLTDGLANVGITSPSEIRRIVRDQYQDRGIAISTFGLGAGYNEDLLTGMAEVGGGNYYFIERGEQIAGIFDRELKGLLSVLGQDAIATITLPPGTMCEKVYGYPYEVTDGRITIRLSDIYANDEKGVVIRLRSNRLSEGLALNAALSYTEAESSRKIRDSKSLRLAVAPSRRVYDESIDAAVDEKIAFFEANDEFESIMAEVDKGNYDVAKKRAAGTVSKLKEKQASRPSAALKDREAQISKYADEMEQVQNMAAEDRSMYQKSNKSVNYESTKMRKK
jgi:Ca-activated chloride channel family protein